MSKFESKKVSRRDAIKLLTAATGAAVLANLPNKWSKPEVNGGVFPVHAQTSGGILHLLACDTDQNLSGAADTAQYLSGVTINPFTSGIPMNWSLTLTGLTTAGATSGTVLTNGSGYAQILTPPMSAGGAYGSVSIRVNWSFQNSADGKATCYQLFSVANVTPIAPP